MKYSFPGLSASAVEKSRREHGSNDLPPIQVESFFDKLKENFEDPLIKILCVALVITLALAFFGYAEWYEGVGIASAVFLATFVSTYSEYKNEASFQLLQQKASLVKNNVFRNGGVENILATEIVVGDYVLLQIGDRVPADGVLAAGEVYVKQDTLDGEPKPRRKVDAPVNHTPQNRKDLTDKYLVFRGTLVDNGEGVLLVRAVGDQSLYGEMYKDLVLTETRESPLQVKLSALADLISHLGYIGAIFIAISFLFKQFVMDNNYNYDEIVRYVSRWHVALHDVVTSVILAIIVIVVAVPEGLPMMIAIVLSLNMRKLLKANVLVRKLLGIETAGSIDILFVDKTGTLTMGVFHPKLFISGDLKRHEGFARIPRELQETLAFAVRESTSSIISPNGQIVGGNETDKALLEFLGPKHLLEKLDIKITKQIPFRSERKFSAAAFRVARKAGLPASLNAVAGASPSSSKQELAISVWKGTPEKVMSCCTHYLTETGERVPIGPNAAQLAASVSSVSQTGSRVLATALSDHVNFDDDAGIPHGLTLIGIVGVLDEIRPESRPAVLRAQQAGVQVVMITGDKQETAVSVAQSVGLLDPANANDKRYVLGGVELNAMTDSKLKEIIPTLRVISSVVPNDKARLVKVAQECGRVVGMTGDGVNDSLALKQSDVGFALGSGSEMAKEAADIVVLDNNFNSITQAILYGRTIYKSIQKFIVFQSTINVASSTIVFLGPFLGFDFPLTLIQLLWVNLVMDTLAALAFGGEPALQSYMSEKPINRTQAIITPKMGLSIMTGGLFIAGLSIFALSNDHVEHFFQRNGKPSEAVFLTAFFAFFVFLSVINAFNVRTTSYNPFNNLTRNSGFLIVVTFIFAVQISFTYIGGKVLRTVGLTQREWIAVILASLIIIPWGFFIKVLSSFLFPDSNNRTVTDKKKRD